MLCKPSHHDRFDRRVISLAAFKLRHGHLNVPEVRLPAFCAPHLLAPGFPAVCAAPSDLAPAWRMRRLGASSVLRAVRREAAVAW